MSYCRSCGTEISPYAANCPNCGVSQRTEEKTVHDSGSPGWTVLGCCIPLVGLILWLVWKDEKPESAKAAGIGALLYVGFVVLSALLGSCGAML